MRPKYREFALLVVVCALVSAEPTNRTAKKISDNDFYDYEEDDKVLYPEEKPCPRDCICTVSQGYRIANCNRLELGTQKFGDISDLVIENADPRFPIELVDYIFMRLGLQNISTVKIVNSTISFVGPKAFHGLSDLYAVNLSGNKLRSLNPETFANNKKLLLLTLANNPLKFPAKGSSDYFLNATSVQELDISNCNMKYVTRDAFKNMSALMYLNVAGNNLYDVHPEAFKKLLDLEELDLGDNNLLTLPNDIFSENTELATLHIPKNPIESVYGLNVSDLLTLNAGQTNIKLIGPSMFNGMKFIANLNLSVNGIEKIHNQAFHKLVELNYLDLSSNKLDFISNILIKENIELEIFKIANNPNLKHLPAEGFECSADIQQFNIYRFDASKCGLEELFDNTLHTFTALSQIVLSDNNIKTIGPRVFSYCPKLVEIDLANNLLMTLDHKMFAENKELGKLILQGNPIKTISSDMFVATPVLKWLDVSRCELTTLWENNKKISVLGELNYLNVSNNRINEIRHTEVEPLKKLRILDVNYNPLVCNREFENLMTLVNNRTITPTTSATSIANLERDAHPDRTTYSWEALADRVCGAMVFPPPAPAAPAVSDEEIWERINKDEAGNFDLKDTLDDAKTADDVAKFDINQIKKIDTYDDGNEEDEDDDDDYDDDMELKVNLIEKPKKVAITPPPFKESVEIDVQLLDREMFEEAEGGARRGGTDWLWLALALSAAVLLLAAAGRLAMSMCARGRGLRYDSALVAAMKQAHSKKDCGLVYRPLSEDLSAGSPPRAHRYQPLPVAVHTTYESGPFHHNNVVPEAV